MKGDVSIKTQLLLNRRSTFVRDTLILTVASALFLPAFSQPRNEYSRSAGVPYMALPSPPAGGPFSLPLPFINKGDAPMLAMIGLSTLFLSRIDAAIDEEYALEGHPFFIRTLRTYGHIGKLYDTPYTAQIFGGLALAITGYGYLGNQPEVLVAMKEGLQSLLISSIITGVIKTAVGRNRPYLNKGAYEFEVLEFRTQPAYLSFPSGHTASIFSIMTVLARHSQSRWIKGGAYAFAGSVGFQRVLDRKHWASDVVAGGVLGYLIGKWVTTRGEQTSTTIRFMPISNGQKHGIGILF